ncbi:uncharacterized protein LOC127835465 [Dreissena polymorpha]|nr:uncharacterized protein LOC127835465 [Dreissena polymorpha]
MVDSLGNSFTKSENFTFLIDVMYPPSVKPLQNESVQINTSYTSVCILSNVGNPSATNFTWIRMDNKSIIATEQTLILHNVSLSDEGDYRCIATNTMQPTWEQSEPSHGLSTFHLKVTSIPETPLSFRVQDGSITDSSLTVEWVPGYNGGVDVWFVVRYKKVESAHWTNIRVIPSNLHYAITLEYLMPRTTYELKMFAENRIGSSEETIVIDAITLSVRKDDSSSLIVLISAVAGGVVGGGIIAALVVWRLRKILAKKVPRTSVGRYDELLQSNMNIRRRQDDQYENVAFDHQYDDLIQGMSKKQVSMVEDHKYENIDPSAAYVTLGEKTSPDYTRIEHKTILSERANPIFGLGQFEDSPKTRARATGNYFNLKLS